MKIKNVWLTGTGLFTPPNQISNEDLVRSFNTFVADFNQNRDASEHLAPSDVAFIEKASGIKSRYVMDREGILDPRRMYPDLPARTHERPSVLCEMAVAAARQALAEAQLEPQEITTVICACSNLQRAYPAISVEIQHALGTSGYAYDMNVACSSATFALNNAVSEVAQNPAAKVLIVNPEICTGHLNFRDRDSHFIFGDACTAMVIESTPTSAHQQAFRVLSTKLVTQFSNNIRNDFGFLNRAESKPESDPPHLFTQQGRKVFKEVVPLVSKLILDHLEETEISPAKVRRLWLHQANLSMNQLIAKRVFASSPEDAHDAPVILDRYANTSSAGSVIAFHQHKNDMPSESFGVLCSFGAGYSAGSIILQKG